MSLQKFQLSVRNRFLTLTLFYCPNFLDKFTKLHIKNYKLISMRIRNIKIAYNVDELLRVFIAQHVLHKLIRFRFVIS